MKTPSLLAIWNIQSYLNGIESGDMFYLFDFWIQSFTIKCWASWDSLCKPAWPWTHRALASKCWERHSSLPPRSQLYCFVVIFFRNMCFLSLSWSLTFHRHVLSVCVADCKVREEWRLVKVRLVVVITSHLLNVVTPECPGLSCLHWFRLFHDVATTENHWMICGQPWRLVYTNKYIL